MAKASFNGSLVIDWSESIGHECKMSISDWDSGLIVTSHDQDELRPLSLLDVGDWIFGVDEPAINRWRATLPAAGPCEGEPPAPKKARATSFACALATRTKLGNGNIRRPERFFFSQDQRGDSKNVVADAEEERAWAGPSAVQLCARLTRARERGAGGSVWVGARVACP